MALEIYAPQRPPIVVQTLEAGDILGWSWLVPPYRWRRGVVTSLFRQLRLHPDRTVVFVCGPEIMMNYVVAELEQHRGVSAADIYLSMERNMKCAVGFCGHCQYGPYFICKDGPVFSYQQVRGLIGKHEL